MKIAVVGATGLVGREMLTVLSERGFGLEHDRDRAPESIEIIAAASAKSVGKPIDFAGRKLTVMSVDDAIAARPDYAIFSAGAAASRQYAPLFAQVGTTVIDNSSAWRKDPQIPLVVPEINIDVVKPDDRIIANPNCSTIQMVLAISALQREYGIRRIVISTYQSITGTGVKAVRQLEAEERGETCEMAYPYPIHRNLFPHGGDFLPDGYTTEEQKLVDETRKIFADPSIMSCSATSTSRTSASSSAKPRASSSRTTPHATSTPCPSPPTTATRCSSAGSVATPRSPTPSTSGSSPTTSARVPPPTPSRSCRLSSPKGTGHRSIIYASYTHHWRTQGEP